MSLAHAATQPHRTAQLLLEDVELTAEQLRAADVVGFACILQLRPQIAHARAVLVARTLAEQLARVVVAGRPAEYRKRQGPRESRTVARARDAGLVGD